MIAQTEEQKEDARLEWIVLRKEMDDGPHEETQKEKLLRKMKSNPFVPIGRFIELLNPKFGGLFLPIFNINSFLFHLKGCLATTAALSVGLWSMKKGDRQLSQKMMRARIVAQGFTVIALLVGVGAAIAK